MSEGAPAPLGLLGGTFDPIHYGHLRLAEEAIDQLSLASVRLVPAGAPPHRTAPMASADARLAMVRLAAAGNCHLTVDDAEVRSSDPSYTVLTLERLRNELGPVRPLVWLVGADAFRGLTTWHRWEALLELAHLGVATRPGHPLDVDVLPAPLARVFNARRVAAAGALAAAPAGCILPFTITALDISATALRAALAAGRSPRYLLPEPTLDYIQQHQLYLAP